MKTDELSTKDKRNDLIIQKNLVPNVVAVNRRELIDFDKQFLKEEKERKSKPLSKRLKEKQMVAVYL